MLTRERAKKLLSIGTHNKLNDLLFKLENVESPREISALQEKLRDYMGKLFTYKDIFEFHNDHLFEMAEILVGLYPEKDNLEDYTYHILVYLNKKISRYKEIRFERQQALARKAKEQKTDPDGYLDQKYIAWTYTEGYYYQQAQRYRLLQRYLTDLVEFTKKGRGAACRKKTATGKNSES